MANSGRVYFGLRGDFIPDELTAAIGIKPTMAKMAGERIPGNAPKCSIWEYSTEEVEGEVVDIYELSTRVVRDLGPFAVSIAAEVQERELVAVLQVVLWISTNQEISTPIIGSDAQVSLLRRRDPEGVLEIHMSVHQHKDGR